MRTGLIYLILLAVKAPRLFKTLRIRLERLDIEAYRQEIGAELKPIEFKRAVRLDLDRRRELHCPPMEARS